LSGQAFQYKIDASGFVFGGEDRLFNESTDLVSFIPDANAGFYWTSENYFVGFSANQLFKSVLKLGNEKLQHLELLRHYYLMGGYRFPLSNELDIEPSILVKTTEQWITQADMTIRLAYLSNYWLGFSYRTSGAIATICGISLDKFNMGISYDYSLNSIQKHSLGSAEVVMVMKFGSNARRYRWVNRY
jgi:type IX secretion system PorP/SprF family membrane protein